MGTQRNSGSTAAHNQTSNSEIFRIYVIPFFQKESNGDQNWRKIVKVAVRLAGNEWRSLSYLDASGAGVLDPDLELWMEESPLMVWFASFSMLLGDRWTRAQFTSLPLEHPSTSAPLLFPFRKQMVHIRHSVDLFPSRILNLFPPLFYLPPTCARFQARYFSI